MSKNRRVRLICVLVVLGDLVVKNMDFLAVSEHLEKH
jgi:hypothetical protein